MDEEKKMASDSILFPFLCGLTLVALLTSCGPDSNMGEAPVNGSESIANPLETPDNSTPELGNFGIDMSHQDPETKAGDDFFRYANGGWLDTFELPASRSSYGSFTVLSDRSDQRVRGIIEDLSQTEPTQGSIEQKISDYYLSYMNTEALNDLGISPLLPGLSTLDAIATIEELIQGFGLSLIHI